MSLVLWQRLVSVTTAVVALSIVYEVIHISTKRSTSTSMTEIITIKIPALLVLSMSILFYSFCLFLLKATLHAPDTRAVEAFTSTGRSIVDPIIQAISSRSSKRRHRRKRQQDGLMSTLQANRTNDCERSSGDDVSDSDEISSAASLLPFSLSLSTASITTLWEDLFLSPESAVKSPFRILKPEEEDELFFASNGSSFDDGTESDDDNRDDSILHFCFLVHGFRGHSRDLSYVQAVMRRLASMQKSTRQLVVHSSQCNEKKTDDGIIAGGTRLFNEMVDVIRSEMLSRSNNYTDATGRDTAMKTITLSLWGNSLGGLYTRYALSLLSEHFPVSNSTSDGKMSWILDDAYVLHLNVFCTTAAPHLGISGHTFVTLPRRAEIGLASAMGTTGKDLFRINSILYEMATSDQFILPMSLFRKRICYANAYGTDFPVPASTAAFLSESSTYPHRVSDDDSPNDDSLVQIATLYTTPGNRGLDKTTTYLQTRETEHPALDTELAQMSISLDSLGWKKVFVDMRKEVPHIVLPKSLIRGGSGSKSMFSSKTLRSTPPVTVTSMTSSTESERSSQESDSSDEEDDVTEPSAATTEPSARTTTYPVEPIHRLVSNRRILSSRNTTNADTTALILSSKDVAAAVSTSALLYDTIQAKDEPSTVENRAVVMNDERDDANSNGKDTTTTTPSTTDTDKTHFSIHWPLGHNMIVAFSRSRWSAHMNKAGRPVVDALAKEIVNDILSFHPENHSPSKGKIDTTIDTIER